MRRVSCVLAVGAFLAVAGSAAPPANDNLALAESLVGFTATANGSNVEATAEEGELRPGGTPAQHSVWWSWDAPDSGPAVIDLHGSFAAAAPGIYQGKYANSLSVLAAEAFTNSDATTVRTFTAVAGANYKIAVDGGGGAQGSINLELRLLTLGTPPLILQQPAPLTLTEGEVLRLAVRALSKSAMHYSWWLNATNAVGADSSDYSRSSVLLGEAGNYQVVVRNGAGSVTSVVAAVTVRPKAPVIAPQPVDQTLVEGQSATFSVGVSSSMPVRYQWQFGSTSPFGFGGADLPNQTNPTLNLNGVVVAQAGGYRVIVANSAGSATSQVARLTVNLHPTNDDFVNRTLVRVGTNVVEIGSNLYATKEPGETNHAGLKGEASVWWSWLAPATGLAELDLTGSFPGAVAGLYTGMRLDALTGVPAEHASNPDGTGRLRWQVVANMVYQIAVDGSARTDRGGVRLRVAFLGPIEKPIITRQPQGSAVFEGAPVELSVEAFSITPMTYQWSQNGISIPAARASTLSYWKFTANQAGTYQVVVSNAAGTVSSMPVVLTVLPLPPLINAPPLSQEVTEGDNVLFTVGVQGEAEADYQWFFYADPLPDETQAILRLDNVRTNQAGNYQVRVSNAGGATMSRAAALVVHSKPINDSFTNRIVLTGTNVIVTGYTNQYAGIDPGEPTVPGLKGEKSVWWTWESTGDGVGLLDWQGSYGGAVVGVFEGDDLATLEPVELIPVGAQKAWFRSETGKHYQIVVNSTEVTESGMITFRLTFYPNGFAPEIIEQPADLEIVEGQAASMSVGATSQTPLRYQWSFRQQNAPSWAELPGETNLAVSFATATIAVAGDYQVLVSNGGGSVLSRTARLVVHQRPANNDFAARAFLSGSDTTRHAGNQYANSESGEPHHGGGTGNASVWWTWLPPGDGLADVDLSGSFRGAVLGIYTGNRVDGLTSVPVETWLNPDGTSKVRFRVSSGGLYHIAVDGNAPNVTGDIWVHISYDAGGIHILGQPGDLQLDEGQTATFNVSATSKVPIWYQWRHGGTNLVGQSGPRLSLLNVAPEHAGSYDVLLSNSFTVVRSRVALLNVVPKPPVIMQQPQSQEVAVGETVRFSVRASSSTPCTYQWERGSLNIEGAVSDTLILTNVQTNQSGSYRVTISNAGGPIASAWATLGVHPRPSNDNFSDRIFLSGSDESYRGNNNFATHEPNEPKHAEREGNASIWWSWSTLKAGLADLDLTGSFPNAVAGVYTNSKIELLKEVSVRSMNSPNGTVRLQFRATPSLPYQIAIDGSSPGESGTVVWHLRVIPPPVITQQPQSQAVALGDSVQLGVTAESSVPMSFQWQHGGVDIPGATAASLSIGDVEFNDLGSYQVQVTSDAGFVTSQTAVVSLTTVIRGQITDASNGRPLAGVAVVVGGITNFTDSIGNYRIVGVIPSALRADFDADHTSGEAPFTVQFFDLSQVNATTLTALTNGYIPYVNTRIDLVTNQVTDLSFSITPAPPFGGLRFVLNWGAAPRDLDLHLMTPPILGERYEVYYPQTQRGSLLAVPFAQLDVDQTNGYGPETITIAECFDGTYRCYAHKYAGLGELSGSKVVINIYTSSGLLRTINVPTEGSGRYWQVCDLDGASKQITIINQLSDSPPPAPAAQLMAPDAPPGSTGASDAFRHIRLQGPPDALSFLWAFGDGTGSTEQNPRKTYTEPGVYTVRLMTSWAGVGADIEVKTNFITVRSKLVPPAIVEQPQDLTLPTGADALFKVVASGSMPLLYQWRRFETDLAGETNSTLLLTNVSLSAAGVYSVTVSNVAGSVTSRLAQLNLLPPNAPPVLSPIADRHVNELASISFQIQATDPDGSKQVLTYSLRGEMPVGVSLDPSAGEFTWTPREDQGPGTNSFVVLVTDNGNPPLSDSTAFTITVDEVNQPPVWAPLQDMQVDEGTTVDFTAQASDPDLPQKTLTFRLGDDPPNGATIDPVTGHLNWTPGESDGPGIRSLTLVVTDNGSPPLSATNRVSIVVREVNQPPELSYVPDFVTGVSQPVLWTNSASDADLPRQWLTFALAPGAPLGASIDAASGVFSWTPSLAQSPSTNAIQVIVTDDGTPALSDAVVFMVTVSNILQAPTLSLTSPEDFTMFLAAKGQTTNVLIEADLNDPRRLVDRVAFYEGQNALQEVTTYPYRFVWEDVQPGGYLLTARGLDAQGNEVTRSGVVHVLVGPHCSEVALQQNSDGQVPEFEVQKMQDYLFEKGILARVFSRAELSPQAFRPFDVVVWDDLGMPGLTQAHVALFKSLQESGKNLVFVGDALLTSFDGLDSVAQADWASLIHLQPAGFIAPPGIIHIERTEITDSEAYPGVGEFSYIQSLAVGAPLGEASETVVASVNGGAVALTSIDYSLGGTHRTFAQALRVTGAGDAASLEERKKLFLNAVEWLSPCNMCPDVGLVVVARVEPQVAEAGQQMLCELDVSLNGECGAAGVEFEADFPASCQVLDVLSGDFDWQLDGNRLKFTRPWLPLASLLTIQAIVRPSEAGTFAVQWSGSAVNAVRSVEESVPFEVVPSKRPVLSIEPAPNHQFHIIIAGPDGTTGLLETSTELKTWSLIDDFTLTQGRAEFYVEGGQGTIARYYRARLQ